MKSFPPILLLLFCITTICGAQSPAPKSVAFAGNAFVTTQGGASIDYPRGLINWNGLKAVISVYFRLSAPALVQMSLQAQMPQGSNSAIVQVNVGDTPIKVQLSGIDSKPYYLGSFNLKAGYTRVTLQGLSKDGRFFGEVSALNVLQLNSSDVVYANDADNYYWSRRGPSVHLSYSASNVDYFYNEVTVPKGGDSIGTYYMANGFNGGYFGIQVKSPSERWILFSVWDPPAPSQKMASLFSAGSGVLSGRFGGEGTGGQAYLVYNWTTGNTYKFVTGAVSVPSSPEGPYTLFSTWFYAPETNAWKFMATWKLPDYSDRLNGLYSFLENFDDTRGYIQRKAYYGNQYTVTSDNQWTEVTQAWYDGDDTANKKQRMDYGGGVEGSRFYLRNCGFFSDFVPVNQDFKRTAGQRPNLDVRTLPQQ